MEDRKATEAIERPPSQARLQGYRPPTLIAYGSVAKLTQGDFGSLAEGTQGMTMTV